MQLERQMLVVKDDSLNGCLTRLWRLLYIGMLGMCISYVKERHSRIFTQSIVSEIRVKVV